MYLTILAGLGSTCLVIIEYIAQVFFGDAAIPEVLEETILIKVSLLVEVGGVVTFLRKPLPTEEAMREGNSVSCSLFLAQAKKDHIKESPGIITLRIPADSQSSEHL